ncbi:uncharacterized protein EHS24_007129 [Apiotrichum porosum]|uniref:Uncharacterized protein n=1 Tax=Apiotrichum porosum TaxID=105984 RepID=A0A427XXJ3_9TREE|nr:uncharacterized protein EHS24_007129 [Apiotrichum porosum]RSH83445.1 hypothetical protein EHS24_007129 [Apiotrichum porosum]
MVASPLLPPAGASSRAFIAPSVVEGQQHLFHQHDTLNIATRITLQSAGAGLLVSAVQNALDRHDRGAMGIFTRTGGTIGLFAGMGFMYSFTQSYVANLREKDDSLNGAAGGCAAGFLAGVRARSFPMAVGACAGLGAVIGTFDAAGASLAGDGRQDLSRKEREQLRLSFFKQPKEAATEEAA